MENWIAPRLRCGLGNRLFQTVAAIQTAHKLNREPVFFLPRMSHWEHGNFRTLLDLVPNLRHVETANSWVEVTEIASQKVPVNLPTTDQGIVLSGFFQNTEDWNLDFPQMPSLPGPALPKRDAWAIHFRFGDYTILPHHQIPQMADYYGKVLSEHVPPNSQVVLFSDDTAKALELAKELEERGYRVDVCLSEDTLHIFETWASCEKGGICSNSTFAWWAAYFAYKRYGTKAYFPDTWMTNQPTPAIFNLPFTQSVKVTASTTKPLKAFSYD